MFTTRFVAPIILSTILGFARANLLIPVHIKLAVAGPRISVVGEFISPFGTTILALDSIELLPGVHAIVVTFLNVLEDDAGNVLDSDTNTSVRILSL